MLSAYTSRQSTKGGIQGLRGDERTVSSGGVLVLLKLKCSTMQVAGALTPHHLHDVPGNSLDIFLFL